MLPDDSIRLEPARSEHASRLQAVLSDVRVCLPFGLSPSSVPHWIARQIGSHGTFCIVHEDGGLIGICRLADVKGLPGAMQLCYSIAWPYWGQGYATAAASRILRMASRNGPARVLALVLRRNAASIRVLGKIGFQIAGVDGATIRYERRIGVDAW